MRLRPAAHLAIAAAGFLLVFSALFAQRGFRTYPDEEVNPDAAIPGDANAKTEWAFARLRYPSGRYSRWRNYSYWGMDFPKADRQFVQGVRRLSRVNARSAEQVVDLEQDDDEIFYWPWTYAVEVGHWSLTDRQVKKLREFFERGGFLMTDDFHGDYEWSVFTESLNRIFPERTITEVENSDAIFHVLYDLDERIQVAGDAALSRGVTYEHGGITPHWRAIADDRGRVLVLACFNQDNGDAWEWADSPAYPERMASQAYRLGINTIIYAMTH
jgi:hypothetical protein